MKNPVVGFFFAFVVCVSVQQVFCYFSTGDEDTEAGKVTGKKKTTR